jgi:hypothetical protein
LNQATAALATALALQDPRLVGAVTRSMRATLGLRAGQMPPHHDGLATQSLLLRQLERVAIAGDFNEAKPIFSAFRSAVSGALRRDARDQVARAGLVPTNGA